MYGGLGAPLGDKAAHTKVDLLVEAQEVADDAPVEEGAVGVDYSDKSPSKSCPVYEQVS